MEEEEEEEERTANQQPTMTPFVVIIPLSLSSRPVGLENAPLLRTPEVVPEWPPPPSSSAVAIPSVPTRRERASGPFLRRRPSPVRLSRGLAASKQE